jgi:membrane protease YdiL (CAAX protease family)
MKAASRLIHPPPPSGRSGIFIILAASFLLTIVSFSGKAGTVVVALSLLLVVLSLLTREIQAFHLAWFTAAFVTAPYVLPRLHGWPYLLLIPLLCYSVPVLVVPNLRSAIGYLHIGRFDRHVKLLALCFIFVPAIALFIWYRAIGPDLAVHLAHVPAMPIWMLPFAGLGFALGNAAVEEFAYRGIILQSLESAAGPGILSLLTQAWLFGALHYREGFPNGAWGVAMTAVYGIMLGVVRRRSQGMLAPWVVHVFADCVIFIILMVGILKSSG